MSGAQAETPTLHLAGVGRDLAAALDREEVRASLAAQLPAWLRPKRWFGGQTRELTTVDFVGWVPLGDDEEAPAVLVVIRATDTTGAATQHPLFLYADADGTLTEALERPGTRQRLLAILLEGDELLGTGLHLIGDPTGPVDGLTTAAPSRIVGAQQSNSSIIYGDRAIMKVYRRLESGPNPEIELGRYLSVEAGLAAIPRVYADGRLVGDGTTLPADFDAALFILQAFVPNEGDGWEWALAQGDAALVAGDESALAVWLRDNPALLAAAAELGRTTARMHAALANATGDELAPRPTTAADVATWASAVGQEAQATTASLARSGHRDADLQRAIERAQRYPPPAVKEPGLLTRVHGDYHLGQTIRGEQGFMILDFEGEPARPLAYRRRHQHPLVDVAGMTRSWGYAAHAAAEGRATDTPVAALESALREQFLAAYWSAADAAPRPFLPPDAASRMALLRIFELAKALYEVRYELDNRPAMVNIPGDAVKRLMSSTNDE